MRYYRLPAEEWHRLSELAALHHKVPPPFGVSSAIVAEDDSGRIVLAAFFMLAYHFQNLMGLPDNGASVSELHSELERGLLEQLPPDQTLTYYTFVRDEPRALAVAARNGLVAMPGLVVHSKVIGGN